MFEYSFCAAIVHYSSQLAIYIESKVSNRPNFVCYPFVFRAFWNPHSIPFLQELPMSAMAALYRRAHAFVLPTRGEGWCLPLLEAMVAGVPSVATAWSGLLEFATPVRWVRCEGNRSTP